MDIVIDGGYVRREGYVYCTLSCSGGYLYKKDGTGVKAYLMGACISEGVFLYSKIWDFTHCCRYSQSRWRWRNKAFSSHNCTIYCVHIPIHQVNDDQCCYIAGSPTCSSHRFG